MLSRNMVDVMEFAAIFSFGQGPDGQAILKELYVGSPFDWREAKLGPISVIT